MICEAISLQLTFLEKNDFPWLCIPLLCFLSFSVFTGNLIVGAWTILTDFNYSFPRCSAAIFGVDFQWGVIRGLYYDCNGLVKIFLT